MDEKLVVQCLFDSYLRIEILLDQDPEVKYPPL